MHIPVKEKSAIFLKINPSFKKAIVSIVTYFIFIPTGYAQILSQTLRGKVIDAETQQPIKGAVMRVLNSEPILETSSNEQGEFRLDNVLLGRYSLKISSVGYEDKIVFNWLIKAGKESILNVELQGAIVSLKAVEISAKPTSSNEMLTVSGRTFSVDETKRYPISINDPSRMVMSYAGVTGGYDRDNEIVIRGNSPKGLLWMLEGIEVPSPNHFSVIGSSSGAVSMLSSNMLANSDFITGAFPAEYGNAASGVFDIKLRNGNNEKREYALQAGFLGLEASAEGPCKKGKGASYLANYRYSTTGLFNLLGAKIEGNAIPAFQDASFKCFLPTEKSGVFSIYGLGGLSTITQKMNSKEESFDYKLGVVGASHQYLINDKNVIKSVISFSDKVIEFHDKETYKSYYEKYTGNYIDYMYNVSVNLTSKINSKHTLKTGINYHRLTYNYYSENYFSYRLQPDVYMDEADGTNQSQAYASWKYRITEKITLINGIHFLNLDLNKHYSIEPRSAIKWQLNSSQSLSAAFGIHSRIEPLQTYIDMVGTDTVKRNQYLDFTKARHYVIGYDKIISENLNLRVEVYYQQLYDVPVAKDTASKFSTLNFGSNDYNGPLSNDGTGKNYGLEITIDKKFSSGYFFLVTASFFESTYKAADKVERNTVFNCKYVSNYIVGKEFWLKKERKKIINTSVRFTWVGGRYDTPINLESSKNNDREIRYKQRTNTEKIKDYMRLDLQIGYVQNHPKFNSELRLDIQNATNRQNVFDKYYDSTEEKIITTYHLGIIPIISYKVEF